MSREELALALFLGLAAAVAAGWWLRGLWERLRHGGAAGLMAHEEMAARLMAAEEARLAAEAAAEAAREARTEAEEQADAEAERRAEAHAAEVAALMESIADLQRQTERWEAAWRAATGRTD